MSNEKLIQHLRELIAQAEASRILDCCAAYGLDAFPKRGIGERFLALVNV